MIHIFSGGCGWWVRWFDAQAKKRAEDQQRIRDKLEQRIRVSLRQAPDVQQQRCRPRAREYRTAPEVIERSEGVQGDALPHPARLTNY